MRVIKTIVALVISIGLLGASAYMYREWHIVTDEVGIKVQAQESLLNAVDVLEREKETNSFEYSLSRKYELPNQTLWEIKITKWGMSITCDILEASPRIDFNVDSEDWEKVTQLLEENNIDFNRVRQLY